jgi:hypothetical protein
MPGNGYPAELEVRLALEEIIDADLIGKIIVGPDIHVEERDTLRTPARYEEQYQYDREPEIDEFESAPILH